MEGGDFGPKAVSRNAAEDLVSPVGIEPTTPRLKVSCSTD